MIVDESNFYFKNSKVKIIYAGGAKYSKPMKMYEMKNRNSPSLFYPLSFSPKVVIAIASRVAFHKM